MPEAEAPDPARCVGPIIDCLLQALQLLGSGDWGGYVSPAEHRALEISFIRAG